MINRETIRNLTDEELKKFFQLAGAEMNKRRTSLLTRKIGELREEGMSAKEIAAQLDMTVRTVYDHYRRLKHNLYY